MNFMASSFLALLLVFFATTPELVHGELSPYHYKTTCPNVLQIVASQVEAAVAKEPRMGASLLRLHFHDCFVNGCDASILLDDNTNFIGEKSALPNNNSVRGFDVIDNIKSEIEKACSGVVSCADILTIAARDSVVSLGGPSWQVKLGRRDSLVANKEDADNLLPSPKSDITGLIASFSSHGLGLEDLVALSGSHTVGMARCGTFSSHIYSDSNVNPSFANALKEQCPITGNSDALQPLDLQTSSVFDNFYFSNLLEKKGLLRSDQELFNGTLADSLVREFATDPSKFFNQFGLSMIKMGDIKPLTGSSGQIRRNCRKSNDDFPVQESISAGLHISMLVKIFGLIWFLYNLYNVLC